MARFTQLARRAALGAVVALGAALLPASPVTATPAPMGHVYVQTNDASGNEVVSFARAADGSLAQDQVIGTGGAGIAPTGLGSQGSVAIDDDGEHLLVVNAGSDDVSLFTIAPDGLHLTDVTRVGDVPVSVDVAGRLVYVLNQGADTIQALRISDEDTLVRIPRSTRSLSGPAAGGAQVAFSADGRLVAVTEKGTQTIDTYVVRRNGRAVGPNAQASSGAVPFGFAFGPDGRLFVSEAPGSGASSYDVASDGTLSTITASLGNGQGAACWLVVTGDGGLAFTANAATANVSGYTIASDGRLTLVGDGNTGSTPDGPVDLDLTGDDGFLYVLSARAGAVTGFEVDAATGGLTSIGGPTGLATGWAGLIAT